MKGLNTGGVLFAIASYVAFALIVTGFYLLSN